MRATIACDADLPEDEVRRRIDAPSIEHDLTRFVVLAAELAGIDAEVSVRRSSPETPTNVSGITFAPRDFDRFVRRPGENAGMAVKRAAHLLARAHFHQHRIDHLTIRLHARLTFLVVRLKAAHVAIHLLHPQLDDAVRCADKHHVRFFDVAATERRDVRTERHADADAHQTPRTIHPQLPCWLLLVSENRRRAAKDRTKEIKKIESETGVGSGESGNRTILQFLFAVFRSSFRCSLRVGLHFRVVLRRMPGSDSRCELIATSVGKRSEIRFEPPGVEHLRHEADVGKRHCVAEQWRLPREYSRACLPVPEALRSSGDTRCSRLRRPAEAPAQIIQHAQIVQRMDIAGDRERHRTHARTRVGSRQERRRRVLFIEVLDDRERLRQHCAVVVERRDQSLRIQREVVGGAMLVLRGAPSEIDSKRGL